MDTRPEGASDQDVAVSTLRLLWPGSEVKPAEDHRADHGDRRFLLLPSARRVRIVAPLAPRGATVAALARNSAPVSARQEVTRALGRWGLAAGMGRWMPDRLDVLPGQEHAPSVLDLLAEALGQPVAITIQLGTSRANRKPVLRVLDRSGRRTLAFAKAGITDLTRSLVTDEARALELLGTVSWRTFRAPRMVALLPLGDAEVLVMSALPSRGARGLPDPNARRTVIEELTEAFGTHDESVGSGPLLQELRRRLEEAGGDLADELDGLLADVQSTHAADHLRVGAWHGDFTPWNMMRASGTLWLWDWERFSRGVPVGLDELHYSVNATTHREGFTPQAVLAGLRAAAWRPADASEARLLPATYLATIATRYVSAASQPGGHAVASEARAAVSALAMLLGRAS